MVAMAPALGAKLTTSAEAHAEDCELEELREKEAILSFQRAGLRWCVLLLEAEGLMKDGRWIYFPFSLLTEHKTPHYFPLNAFLPVIQASAAVLRTSQMVLY